MEIQAQTPSHTQSQPDAQAYRLHRRFDRMGRLVGDPAMRKLQDSHVMVIGLGGVGSWAAEAIVRAGVGKVTIVDFDEVCITNSNRQLHALTGLVGSHKATVLAERFQKVNPQAEIISMVQFYNERNNPEIFAVRPDYVIDAIDNVTAKCHLLAYCVAQKIPVVCCSGSAGRMDPTKVEVADLAVTEGDPLARVLRRILRQQYGFPEKGDFNIPTVFSREPILQPGRPVRGSCERRQRTLHKAKKRQHAARFAFTWCRRNVCLCCARCNKAF
jgi:tRNA A37 threonylcarbamoyladenosine dehydratase